MAILVNDNTTRQIARGISIVDGSTATNKFLIYQGSIPSNLTNWVEADSSSDLLVTFDDFSIANTSNTPRAILAAAPANSVVNAVKTGTAFWYAFVAGGVITRYFFGNVSLATGAGSLTIDSLSLTLGQPSTFVNWSIEATTT